MENKNTQNNNQNEDIDVTEIASLLKRKWHLILFSIIGSALISIPYSLTRPKIWEGKGKKRRKKEREERVGITQLQSLTLRPYLYKGRLPWKPPLFVPGTVGFQ